MLLLLCCLSLFWASLSLTAAVSLFNAAKVQKGRKKLKKHKKGLKKLKRHESKAGEFQAYDCMDEDVTRWRCILMNGQMTVED